ncbi:MAG: cation-transporting P-type ATPase [Tenericutes bacterium]|nr:cation-transporting P-type ATPase [Mycoplasmatota bacterium]
MEDNYEYYDKNKVLKELKTSLSGLSDNEVKKRTIKYGLNELPKEEIKSIYQLFFLSLKDPIIYVLIFAAILSFVAKEAIDGFAIMFIIIIDATLSSFQEYRAEKNSEALKKLIKVKVKVIRGDRHLEIDSSRLVPGDIVVIESGTKISADMRIINSNNLTIDESILTGESIAVNKNSNNIKLSDSEKSCILYAGTSVLTGRAMAVVIRTGVTTEIGKIAEKVALTEESKSPLTIKMDKFSKQISIIIIISAVVIGFILVNKNYAPMEIFLAVVALSVSAMPEGLPLALTMALTIGSNRMSKKNVIVKKLNSVESLGSCTVIASDKTGTLTVNEQTAKIILLPDGQSFEIEGSGYNDNGKVVEIDNANIENAKYISKLAFINNEALFQKTNNKWEKFGDSIDIAFLVLSHKLKTNKIEYKKVHEIPYESEKKFSALFYKEGEKIRCTVKGSIEEIINFCSYSYVNGKRKKIDIKSILKQNEYLASNGYRVIALCDGEVPLKEKYGERDINNLNFVGLVGFIDPVRKEAISSIKKCNEAGIKVIMITGDHALTAYAIAKELKMVESKDYVVTGSDLEFYIDDNKKFDKFIEDKKVFARVTPMQKLKIVESLQRQGEFVAVTGDGVNDAPAIKIANIGVAMGSGTDVAKETSKMIIRDDNFASIVSGIEEGRNAYSNIRKISLLLLSCGFAEVLFFVLSIIFDLPLPLVAIQLLWLNLVTDGMQDIALSFERETDNLMKSKPRNTKESLFEKELIKQILTSGTFIGILVFIVWSILIKQLNMEVEHARGYILALMVFIQNMHVLNCRSETKSVFENSFKNNRFILYTILSTILLQVIVMEVPLLSRFLQTYSIPYDQLLLLFIISMPIILVMELYKYLSNK